MSKVKTTEVTLPSGLKAAIRRIGFAAHSKLEGMVPSRPPAVLSFALKHSITKNTTVNELREMSGGEAVMPELIEYLTYRGDKERDARIFRVCACTSTPRMTPETIDETLDGADFMALEKHIDELHEGADGDVVDFSATRSA